MSTTCRLVAAAAILGALVGCGQGGQSPPRAAPAAPATGGAAPQATEGELALYLTDSPLPDHLAGEVRVLIERVEGRQKGSSTWETFCEEPQSFDLLGLRNGKSTVLCRKKTHGDWSAFRLKVGKSRVILKNGRTFDCDPPESIRDGVVVLLRKAARVGAGGCKVTFDFNLERSFDCQGDSSHPGGVTGLGYCPTVIEAGNGDGEDPSTDEGSGEGGSGGATEGGEEDTSPAIPPPPPSPSGYRLIQVLQPTLVHGKSTLHFSTPTTSGQFFLSVRPQGHGKAKVTLNGHEVFDVSDFAQDRDGLLRRPVNLSATSTLVVKPTGHDKVQVEVQGVVSAADVPPGVGVPVVFRCLFERTLDCNGHTVHVDLPSATGIFDLSAKNERPHHAWWSSAAWVRWNNEVVFSPVDFRKRSGWRWEGEATLTTPVDVKLHNHLRVDVQGPPRSHLTIKLCGWIADENPPSITIAQPAVACVNSAAPVQVTYSDDFSGIEPGSFSAFWDGQDVTGSFQQTGSSANSTIGLIPGATEGTHSLVVRVRDQAGNVSEVSKNLQVDDTPPVITAKVPGSGTLVRIVAASPAVISSTTLIDVVTWRPTEAASTHSQSPGGYAFSLPDLPGGPAYVWDGEPGFYEDSNGTAYLTGRIVSATDASKRWRVSVWFSRTAQPQPRLELDAQNYAPAGPIDPSKWHYYFMDTGSAFLEGEGAFAGKLLTLANEPGDGTRGFQVGVGANGRNLGFGMSGTLSYSGSYASNQGSVNLDLGLVPSPNPVLALRALVGDTGCGVDPNETSVTLGGSALPTTVVASGEVRAASPPLAPGDYTWTLDTADLAGNHSSASCSFTLTLGVDVTGHVLGGNYGLDVELVTGARVEWAALSSVATVSTEDGTYLLGGLPPVGTVLLIDGYEQGYGRLHVGVAPEQSGGVVTFLPRLSNHSSTPYELDAAGRTTSEVVVTEPESGATYRIAAGSQIVLPSGFTYPSGMAPALSFHRMPQPAHPNLLPAGVYSAYTYSPQPEGVVVPEGIDLSLPNDEDLPPGATKSLYEFNPSTGSYQLKTTLTVSSTGDRLEGHLNSTLTQWLPGSNGKWIDRDSVRVYPPLDVLRHYVTSSSTVLYEGTMVRVTSTGPPVTPGSVPRAAGRYRGTSSWVGFSAGYSFTGDGDGTKQIIGQSFYYQAFPNDGPVEAALSLSYGGGVDSVIDSGFVIDRYPPTVSLTFQQSLSGNPAMPLGPYVAQDGRAYVRFPDVQFLPKFEDRPGAGIRNWSVSRNGTFLLGGTDPSGVNLHQFVHVDTLPKSDVEIVYTGDCTDWVHYPPFFYHSGSTGSAGALRIVLDNLPPQISASAVSPFHVKTTATIGYSAFDPGALPVGLSHVVAFRRDPAGVVTSVNLSLSPSGNLDVGSGGVDGVFSFFLRAYDKLGNYQDSGDFVFCFDTTPPAFNAFTATQNASNVDLFAAISDPGCAITALVQITRSINGAAPNFVTSFGSLTQPAVLSHSDPVSVEGFYVYQALAIDQAGNQGSASTSLLVDLYPPIVSFVQPPSPGVVLGAGATAVQATLDDVSGVDPATVVVLVDGARVEPGLTTAQLNPAFKRTTLTVGLGTLTDGPHTIQITAADVTGKSTTATLSFTKDWFNPEITSFLPDTPPPSNNNAKTFTATYADGTSGINPAGVQLQLTTTPFGGTAGAPVDVTPQATVSATGLTLPLSGLADGRHVLELVVADFAGNTARATRSFTIDTGGPQVTVTSAPPALPTWVTTPKPTVTFGLADAGVGVDPATIRVLLDSVDVTNQASLSPDSVSFSPAVALADGPHSVQVQVSDRVGNAATPTTVVFQVDATPPGKPGIPTAGAHPFQPTVLLRWVAAADNLSGLSHYVLLRSEDDGKTYSALVQTSNLEATIPSPTAIGVRYRLVAVDQAGNQSAPAEAEGCELRALDDLNTPISTVLVVQAQTPTGAPITSAIATEVNLGIPLAHQGNGIYRSATVVVPSGQPLFVQLDVGGDVFVSGPLLPLLPETLETNFGVVTITKNRMSQAVFPAGGKSPEASGAGIGLSVGEAGAAGPPAQVAGNLDLVAGFWHTVEVDGDPVVNLLAVPPVVCARYLPIYFEVIADQVQVDVVAEFSLDGGRTFAPITITPGSTLTQLQGTPLAQRHVVLWDTTADLGTRSLGDVLLRFYPTGAIGRGDTETTTLLRDFRVLEVSPAPGAVIPQAGSFALTFSAAPTSTVANLASSVRLLDSGDTSVALSFTTNGTVLTVTPNAPLAAGETYRLLVLPGLLSASGSTVFDQFVLQAGLNPYEATYRAEDPAFLPPTLLSSTPAHLSTNVSTSTPLSLVFSRPLDLATVTDQTFVLFSSADGPVPLTVSLQPDGKTVDLGATLLDGRCYTISVSPRVKGQNGQELLGFTHVSFVTASNFVAPSTPSITAPAPGATLGVGPYLITGTAEPNMEVRLLLNGFQVGHRASTAANGVWAITIPLLPEGTNQVVALAAFPAGTPVSSPSTPVAFTVAAGIPFSPNPLPGDPETHEIMAGLDPNPPHQTTLVFSGPAGAGFVLDVATVTSSAGIAGAPTLTVDPTNGGGTVHPVRVGRQTYPAAYSFDGTGTARVLVTASDVNGDTFDVTLLDASTATTALAPTQRVRQRAPFAFVIAGEPPRDGGSASGVASLRGRLRNSPPTVVHAPFHTMRLRAVDDQGNVVDGVTFGGGNRGETTVTTDFLGDASFTFDVTPGTPPFRIVFVSEEIKEPDGSPTVLGQSERFNDNACGAHASFSLTAKSDPAQNASWDFWGILKRGCPPPDPIFFHNGGVFLVRTDLAIPGRGLHFAFTRTYKSFVLYDGPVGQSWSHNYDQRLDLLPNGDVAWLTGSARNEVFQSVGGGLYRSPTGFFLNLSVDGTQQGTIRLPNGTRLAFRAFTSASAPGKLASIRDRYGNTLTFEYGLSGVALDRLTRVIDVYGRPVDFSYNAEGRIERLRDYLGREVTYTYGSYGDLVKVTSPAVMQTTEGDPLLPEQQFPNGKAEIYAYQNDFADQRLNHDLVMIVAPNQAKDVPDSALHDLALLRPLARMETTWDLDPRSYSFARVTKQRLGGSAPLPAWTEQGTPQEAGGVFELSYLPIAPTASPSLNEPVEVTTLYDRNGNRTDFFHNAAGQCVRQRSYTNRNVRPQSVAPGWGEDPEFFEQTRIYNADGLQLAETLPMGGVTRMIYGNEDLNGDGLLTAGEDRNADGDFDDPEDVQPEDTALFAFNPGNAQLDKQPRFGERNLVRVERYPDARGDTRGGTRPRVATFAYEPIYNAVVRTTDPRAYDPDYVPQNGGAKTPARYTTTRLFDYQQGNAASTLTALAAELSLTEAEVQQLLDDAGVQLGLGDLNGSAADDSRITGDVIRVQAPTVNLTAQQSLLQSVYGDATQEIVSLAEFNDFGQPIRLVDAERNVHTVEYYGEGAPDGGAVSYRVASYPAPGATGGYPRKSTTDASDTDPLRDSGKNPARAQIEASLRYDAVGNAVEVTDPRGIVHLTEVNSLNQVVRVRAAAMTQNLHASEPGALRALDYEAVLFHDANNNVVETRSENAGERDGTELTVATNPYWTRKTAFDLLDKPVLSLAEVEPIFDDAQLTVSSAGVIVSRVAYDPNENVIRVTKPEGNEVAFTYDERNFLFQTIDGFGSPDAAAVTRHYDLNGNLFLVVDAKKHNPTKNTVFSEGDVTRFHIDGFDEVVCTIDPEGNFGASVFDPTGARVRYVRFGPAEEGNPRLSETEWLRDELGRAFQVEARIFQAPYQSIAAYGGLPTVVPVLGDPVPAGESEAVSLQELDALGRTVRSVDAKGDESLACYDGASRVTQVQGPLFSGLAGGPGVRNEVNLFYNQASQVTRTLSIDRAPTGFQEAFSTYRVYDALGRLTRATDPAGQTARVVYDSRSNVVAASDAKSSVLMADPLGLYPGQINDHGNVSHFFYDGLSRPIASERLLQQGGVGNGSLHLLALSNLDTSNSANRDGLITITQTWDRNSRIATRSDDNGNTTKWGYDARDRVTTVGAADLTNSFTFYDADSMVTHTVDRNGTVINNTYDGLGRLLRREASKLAVNLEGTGQSVEGSTLQGFEYDGLSRLRVSGDDNRDNLITGPDDVVCSYTYDSLSRKLTERHRFRVAASVASTVDFTTNRISVTPNAATIDRTITSEYDADSNRTALVYSSGRRLEFSFDGLDRVQRILDQSAGGQQIQGNEFLGARPLASVTANSVLTQYGYDAKRRITAVDHSHLGDRVAGFTYTWGRGDNRASETKLATPAVMGGTPQVSESYTYDSAYRVTRVGFSDGRSDTTYLLDGVGNWIERVEGGQRLEANRRQNGTPGGGSYVPDLTNEYFRLARFDAGGALLSDEGQTHDRNGNRIADGKWRLFFDLFDRLVRVERRSDGVTVGTYRYDAAGRRVHKEFLNPATAAQDEVFFVSDGAREVEELDGSGALRADYVFGALYVDNVVQMRRDRGAGLESFYLHANSLFSISAVTDSSGAVVERCSYSSVYGVASVTDAAGVPRTAANEVGNPWRFTGRRFEAETSLYYYRLRYYDPEAGRFVSRDPLGTWGDPGQRGNGQSYCGCNPVNRVDPLGLSGRLAQAAQGIGSGARVAQEAKKDPWLSRGEGGLMVAGAAGEATVGTTVATLPIPGARVVAGMLVAHAGDLFIRGARQIYSGEGKAGLVHEVTGSAKAEATVDLVVSLGSLTLLWKLAPAIGLVATERAMAARARATAAAAAEGEALAAEGEAVATEGEALAAEALAAKGSGCGPVCFLAGTYVRTRSGRVPIERIKPGDLVLSRDPVTGRQCYESVTRLFRGHTDRVVHLKIAKGSSATRRRAERHRAGLESGGSCSEGSQARREAEDGQEIRCTTAHPFWVQGRGWVRAEDLRLGDELSGSEGERLVVLGQEVRQEEADHYNFEVEGFHTYFVAGDLSAPAVWVHNLCEVEIQQRYEAFRQSYSGSPVSYAEFRAGLLRGRTSYSGAPDAAHEGAQAIRFGMEEGGGQFRFSGGSRQGVEGVFQPEAGGAFPVSLKDFRGTGRMSNLIGRINANANQILAAGDAGNVVLHAYVPQFSAAELAAFIRGGPIGRMAGEGVFSRLRFDAADGIVEVTAAGVKIR
ncbi:MAG: Ig-like domain-containing protein [Planctomycetota bacterium]